MGGEGGGVQEDKQWNFQSCARSVVDYKELSLSSLCFSDYLFFFNKWTFFTLGLEKNHKAIYTEDYKKKKA